MHHSVSEAIEAFAKGALVIVTDDDDRENEGDLIIAASHCTTEKMAFIIRNCCGIVCAPLSSAEAKRLHLNPMVASNDAPLGTAFTVTVDVKHGLTTGISAEQRSNTVRALANGNMGANDFVRPGHVFPLRARPGGVLERAGHTEAAVDISRLAGLYPAGVICEVMNDDGSMARLPDLIAFAQTHGLKIGTIADLIAYRRRNERFVERVLDEPFQSAYGGDFRLMIYRNTLDGGEHAALVKGRIEPGQPTLVRMHTVDFFADMLGHLETRRTFVPAALRRIAEHDGPGVAVFLRDPSPNVLSERIGHGHVEYMGRRALREYGVGAQILLDLGVRDMILMSSMTTTPAALDGYGLKIVGRTPMPTEE